ncbi:unnamed protein product [Acanthoscelides obtectus]|uniref:Uncharacterized protein n=1 Tax=Acanthoscelides obtectus TaxID=200917 RepID=A0A9P0K8H9_ACAOB|nr:unnamed protein product [Acanthoscelides obtectus]CAK1666570.1 hypothetical protein AOBTE_LOCUS25375 [Acanthoscelides obtectus]
METRNIFSDPGKCGNLIEFQSNETMSHFMASFPDNTFWNVNRNVTSGNSTNQGGQSTYLYEQPIDLRISHNDQQRKEDFIDAYYSRSCTKAEGHPKESSSVNTYQQQASQICLDYKKKRRGMSKINPIVLDGDNIAYPASFSPEKQAEIMKAACSLFSKRTRTLYQWMYPNVTKQQVKIAVANYWQSLGQSEKDFYVSQVSSKVQNH